MSICDEIYAREDEGRLFLLRPHAPGVSIDRPLYMAISLKRAILDGPWSDQAEQIRFAATLRSDLERFIRSDGLIRVSLEGHGRPTEDMKRLLGTKEVWTIKSERRRQKGIRVFGCFAEKDVFVATHWHWRDDLEAGASGKWNKKFDWPTEIRRTKTEWRKLFQTYPPHTGNSIDQYITGAEDVTIFD